jgi:hypothetical protein
MCQAVEHIFAHNLKSVASTYLHAVFARMSLPPRTRPATAARMISVPPGPTPSPAPTHRSVKARLDKQPLFQSNDQLQSFQASPLSSHRLISRTGAASAASTSSSTGSHQPAATSSWPVSAPIESPSTRTSYTGIRHLLSAIDINTDDYPGSSWRPKHSSSVEELFADAGGGHEWGQGTDSVAEG